MAYFAQLDDDNVVLQVIAISDKDAPDPAPDNSESLGQAFISDVLGLPGLWKQTSFNGKFRGRYAGIGFTYDADRDQFIAPQPFPSWTLNDDCEWQPPIPYPTDGEPYEWNEDSQEWQAVETD